MASRRVVHRLANASLCVAALLAWPSSRVYAQADSGATVERLADGVYAIIHRDAFQLWPKGITLAPHSNTGVIVGDDGVLVVDATYLPSRARADIALIRQITSKPVRYLVNTHWHSDHTNGNGAYVEAFPRIAILSARANRQFTDINQEGRRSAARSTASFSLNVIGQLEVMLQGGRDSAGRQLSTLERGSLAANIAERRNVLLELGALVNAPPSVVFDDAMTVYLGRKRVDLVNRGRGNTPADVTVYLPDDRVLFAGDLVVMPVPYAFGTNPVPWIGALRAIESTSIEFLVPGHGPVQRDLAYVRQVRELFEAATARVEALVRRNEYDAKKVSLDDFRSRFVKPGDATAAAYWEELVRGKLLEDVAACVQGSRC
ncbi:MAG TPA: MBL fold metallo-hydrolase [Gemmatimonadaceae bacterium]|nr:MBL fold metallo-hydrolase [Gemmatimonadaceae bacterium]